MFTYLVLTLLVIAWLDTMLGRAAKWPLWTAPALTGAAFLLSLVQWAVAPAESFQYGLHFHPAGYVLTAVICFISWLVQSFALRNLAGNRLQRRTLRYLVGLTLALILFSIADHLALMVLGLGLSNFLLSRLIAHYHGWDAARHSGRMALRSLGLATLLLGVAVGVIYFQTGTLTLSGLSAASLDGLGTGVVLASIILAALLQSANWPLHGWLIASANAPTPISAFMHAGLVNGGALILYKFFPLLQGAEWSFMVLFVMGAITAVIGTAWMLVQSDIKRTLTCSTVGQMGFMVMQCGLGLFPAALTHMIWHGLFKASLFLGAGSAITAPTNKSLRLRGSKGLIILALGLGTGAAGAFIFYQFTSTLGSLDSTYLLLLLFCGLTIAHTVMSLLRDGLTLPRLALAELVALGGATLYGASVWWLEGAFTYVAAQPLQIGHWVVTGIFAGFWLASLFRPYLPDATTQHYLSALYVRMLRFSQPRNQGLTLLRERYRA
mgnify:CR=1 FL=1